MDVGRYAPSPTGDLHLGNARTALVAWLWERHAGGRFLLRFEDLDTARVRPGCAEEQAGSLAWLGLDWDGEPVWQSDRIALYEEALETLRGQGALYECFCSRADVRRAASAPHGPDGPRYSGRCSSLSEGERAEQRSLGRTASLRVRLGGASGDIVVRRGDGVIAYQLAVVVDDADQGVTRVVRGADLEDSTCRQLELYRLLGLEPVPRYAHVPLLLGPDGARLAKRHGAVGLAELRAQGADPRALVGWLAHSAGLLDVPRPCTPAELVADFDPALLPQSPTRIEPGEMRW